MSDKNDDRCCSYDPPKKHEEKCSPYGSGIYYSNIVSFAISIANVTDADSCNAQSNAAVIVAGGNIDSKQYNQNQLQDDNC